MTVEKHASHADAQEKLNGLNELFIGYLLRQTDEDDPAVAAYYNIKADLEKQLKPPE